MFKCYAEMLLICGKDNANFQLTDNLYVFFQQ